MLRLVAILGLIAMSVSGFQVVLYAQMTAISGTPVIEAPELLEWPYDRGVVTPNLNDPPSNTVHDLHAGLSSCDLVVSSEGNYHPALRDVWPLFLAKFKDHPLENWFFTTSPPVGLPQIRDRILQVGNVYSTCRPQVVVASAEAIKKLVEAGYTDAAPHPLYEDRGSVILVRSGNPKGIESVWDLGRDDVRYVSPNPTLEPGAFANYANTIYQIAAHDPAPPKDTTAERLIDRIFNGATGVPDKWLAGPRIHHRDLPWSLAHGKGDACVILCHLGLYTKQTFPQKFDIVPLGGSVSDPRPLKGTIISTRFVVSIKGDWTPRQREAREKFIQTLLSEDFTRILENRGMKRPDGFVPVKD